MARNASGTYTLPAGNPVVSGTLIDATWANNTLADLGNEVTDSLSRSGEGAMLAPLRITDGVQATPALAFSNEPSSGLYRAGSNEWWAVAAGVQNLRFTNTGLTTRAAAGAVGTPSLAAFNDTDTGICFPGANQLAIATGGVGALWVDSSQNVGIGTASPATRLEVQAAVNTDPVRISAASNTNGSYQGILFQQGIYSKAAIRGYSTGTTDAGSLTFWTSPPGDIPNLRVTLDSSGNLGIGTTTINYRVVADCNSAGNNDNGFAVRNTNSSAYGGSYNFEHAVTGGNSPVRASYISSEGGSGNSFMRFATTISGTLAERMRLDSSGNLFCGGTTGGSRLNLQTATNSSADSNYITLYNAGENVGHINWINGNGDIARITGTKAGTGASADEGILTFSTATNAVLTERMRLDSSGNLGIGTASPAYKVDASGQVRALENGTGSGDGGFVASTSGANGNAGVLFQTNSASRWNLTTAGTNGADLRIYNYALASTVATFDSSGSLGIGTASPGSRLHVDAPTNTVQIRAGDGNVLTYAAYSSGVSTNALNYYGTASNHDLGFLTNNTERARITKTGNIVAGASAALATTATDGFLYVPTCAGTPTGTPTAITGMAPIVVNTTNNKLYFYSGGAWRDAGP